MKLRTGSQMSVREVLDEWPCPICAGENGGHDNHCALGMALEAEAANHFRDCPVMRELRHALRVTRSTLNQSKLPDRDRYEFGVGLLEALAKDAKLAARGKTRVVERGQVKIVTIQEAEKKGGKRR